MKLQHQRWLDRWVGIPLCAVVSAVARVQAAFAPKSSQPAQKPRAIVIILLSEMGSLVLAHSMFAHLKTRYPDAQIHALLFRKNREILDLMQVMPPAHVHTVDDRSLLALLQSLLKAIRAMRLTNVDVAIDCELFSRISSLLAFASGAAIRVGFHRHTQEGLYRGSHINRRVPYNPYQHISAQFLTLASAIDSTAHPRSKIPALVGRLPGLPPPVVLADGLIDQLRQRLLHDFPAVEARPLVLVYPGGGILPIRAWPLASYTALCQGLLADGCAVAVIGLKDDQALAWELLASVQLRGSVLPIFDLTGYTRSIAELLALFHQADLLVTNDGGPGQFAALTPMRTIMLFGPETPALYAPLSPRCHAFYSALPCSPCLTAYNHRNSYCDGDNQCLKVIAPESVLQKSREFLLESKALHTQSAAP